MEVFDIIRKGIISDQLSLMVFMVLCSMFIIDIILYIIIWINLIILNWQIKEGSIYKEPMQEIILGYEELLDYSTYEVNTAAYVEDFFSSYKVSVIPLPLFNYIKIPVISTVKFIKNSVSLFILVGVLGTFVGIYSSLVNVLGTGQGEMITTIESITPVLTGMGTAFATSIVGMSLALLTSFLLKLFNSEQFIMGIMARLENYLDNEFRVSKESYISRAVKGINNSFSELNSIAKNIYNEIKGFDNFSSQFEEATKYMERFNTDLAGSMEKLQELYESNKNFTASFKGDIENLGQNIGDLNNGIAGFYQHLTGIDKTIKDISENREKTNEILLEIEDKNSKGFQDISNQLKNESKNKNNRLDNMSNLLKEMTLQQTVNTDKYKDIINSIDRLKENFVVQLKDDREQFNDILQNFKAKYNSEMNRSVKTFLEHVDLSNKIINNGFDSIIDKFDNMDMILGKYLHGLSFNTNDLDSTIKELTSVVKNLETDLKKYNSLLNKLSEQYTQNQQYIKDAASSKEVSDDNTENDLDKDQV